ncbi:subtilisin [Paenibacillus sophorae]|uniref:S8 family peptidase n=1 Tax=Paenibacillus sophorae TaxID=1333845 RepID=A0A1H8VEJ0_9BACL|nr:S8 family peptidase [Paenibacillus sophorae]QWU16654.1 S8 family peptidase [Paenibacillus sophorae]SEP13820.1 subtilisin [Paenibacillus sophorae]
MYNKKITAIFFIIFFISTLTLSQTIANGESSKQRKIIVFENHVSKDQIDKVISDMQGVKVKDLDTVNGVVAYLNTNSINAIKSNSTISYIEDDLEVKLLGKRTPSDSVPPLQPTEVLPWGIDSIDAEHTFSTVDSSSIKIAIIDTGVDISHPDLLENIKGGFNSINSKKSYNDDNGHGTHVAGIIAAEHNNIGVVGVVPKANIYAIKAFDSLGNGYLSDIIEGINWSINNNMNVINISFGANADSQLLHDIIIKAYEAGIVVVAAAGNDSSSIVNYPAAYPEVISVSAVDTNFNKASFAPSGKVDVVAPGVNIFSTYLGSMYAGLSGSSMATPHVTGEAAILLSVPAKADINGDGISTPYEIKQIIELTATDLGVPGKDNIYGAGFINVNAAVNKLTI